MKSVENHCCNTNTLNTTGWNFKGIGGAESDDMVCDSLPSFECEYLSSKTVMFCSPCLGRFIPDGQA